MRNSLRFKFVAGFLMIIIPLVFFLLFNNLYATKVVREQVSKTNINSLAQYVKQTDKLLMETNNYLYALNENEIDVNALSILQFGSDDYVITKQKITNRFRTNLGYFKLIDTFFLYDIQAKDLTFSTNKEYYTVEKAINDSITTELQIKDEPRTPEWHLASTGSGLALMKSSLLTNNNLLAGALVNTDTLVNSLAFLDYGSTGGAVILSDNGMVASHTTLSPSKLRVAIAEAPTLEDDTYRIATDPDDGEKYLLIGAHSSAANINYIVMIPEGNMLQQLPFFKLAAYMIPLGGILILIFYLILVRSLLLKPMKTLMHGMNQLMRGDLNVRLNDNHSSEFAFLINTFNNMVLDISRLKIDVYEEKILTQDAEFRLLQAQIRPHFYLNSLNIISSLASIKEYALIQKMTQHLAEYFRFIIHTKRNDVTLEAEIRHIENYLEIQKLRFPNQLEYQVDLPERYRSCMVLPLTILTFVENTIIHGFADRSKLFKIHIRIVEDEQAPDNFLWIIVSDTGVGFPPDLLSKLRDGSYENEVFEEGHLGIQNIIRRQQIRYEGKAMLVFNNIEHVGAEIRIGIPFIEVHKEDQDV